MAGVWLPLLIAGVLFVIWWRSHRVSYVLTLRGGRRQWDFTIGSGQFRLYRRWLPGPEPGGRVRLRRHRGRCFSADRSPMDEFHWAYGNFSYVRGRNTGSGVRYRVLSLPILFPAVISQFAAALNLAIAANR